MKSSWESQTVQECFILSLPFSLHMHYLSLAFVLHPVDEVVLYPFVLTVVNAASSLLRKPKKKTKWSHRKDLTLVGVNMNCTEQTTLVQEWMRGQTPNSLFINTRTRRSKCHHTRFKQRLSIPLKGGHIPRTVSQDVNDETLWLSHSMNTQPLFSRMYNSNPRGVYVQKTSVMNP